MDDSAPPVDAAAFHALPGLEDWRVMRAGPVARYRCDGLPAGASFAGQVAALAATADRQPDIDLRPDSVTVRIVVPEPERIPPDAVGLARAVQAAARGADLAPDPAGIRFFQIAVAHAPGVDVQPFWRAVMGYEPLGEARAEDPARSGPRVWFHEIEHGRAGRGRTHLDVYVPADQADRIVADALAAGGRVADDSNAPDWWTLASPDNHGVDVAPWSDRGWS